METKPVEVQLRDVVDGDLPLFFEQQRDPAYNHMAAFTHADPSNREAFDAHWAKIRRNPTVTIKTILFEGSVVGNISTWLLPRERNVSYGIAREHWGKGLATAALIEFLALWRERPLHARVAIDNVGSRRVLEKCGFKLTGHEKCFAHARGREIEEACLKLE